MSLNLFTRTRCSARVRLLPEENSRKRHGLSVQYAQIFGQKKCSCNINKCHDGKIRNHDPLSMNVRLHKWDRLWHFIITFSDAVKKTFFPLWKLWRVPDSRSDVRVKRSPLSDTIYECRLVTKTSGNHKRTNCSPQFKKSQRDLFGEPS